jgi:protein-disulfide isomerase
MKRFYLLLGAVVVVGAPVPVTNDSFPGYVLGRDSAPIEIVEYADYECPFCAQFGVMQFPTIRDQLITTGKVRWRFRDHPLPIPAHRWARLSAHAVACAGEQGKAWEMMDALFTHHSEWAQQAGNPSKLFRNLARGVGVDIGKYDDCMDSQRYAARIEAAYQEGLARGVQGTPTFFINGRQYTGRRIDSDQFKQIVDSILTHRK